MSTEPLTIPEILALLTREFPPDKGYPWRQFSNDGYCGSVHGHEIVCYKGTGVEDVWYVDRKSIIEEGEGPTIPAAIADFRTHVVAEAVALGAVYLTGSMPVQTDEPCDEFDGQPCVCYAREKCCPHTERRRKERAVEVTLPKPAPSREYNYLEAAIFAAFFQYAYTNSHTPSEAIDAANNAVEEYRATFK